MATPKNAPYKRTQQWARGHVKSPRYLWVSKTWRVVTGPGGLGKQFLMNPGDTFGYEVTKEAKQAARTDTVKHKPLRMKGYYGARRDRKRFNGQVRHV